MLTALVLWFHRLRLWFHRLRRKPELCWICATPMYARHCKLVCPKCGYTRDCSDP